MRGDAERAIVSQILVIMKLFDTTISTDQLDPAYVYIRDGEYCVEVRNYLEALWKEFEPLADPDFTLRLPAAAVRVEALDSVTNRPRRD